jgi:hypothetical protein
MIQHLCREMAGEFYEENKRSARFRAIWPDVRVFIARTWPLHIEVARTILVDMLRRPDSEVPPWHKEKIYEAIVEDRERSYRQPLLNPGRGAIMLRPDQPGTMERAIFHKR